MTSKFGLFFGENELGSEALFEERRRYKNIVSFDSSIDLWSPENSLYGRIDLNKQAVFLSEEGLKQLPSTNNRTFFALDFVVDAFEGLKAKIDELKFQGVIKETGPIAEMKVYKAWESLNFVYHKHMETVYDMFVSFYLRNTSKEQEVINVKSFLDMFFLFCREFCPTYPITRTGFILSRFCAPHINGMIIDIGEPKNGDDLYKSQFMLDDNFLLFVDVAKKYGFAVDKNAPWRLVADLESDKMQKYIREYGISKGEQNNTNLFELYFFRTVDFEPETLKTYLIQFWNSYAIAYPEAQRGNCVIARRQTTDDAQDDLYWLHNYIDVRSLETVQNVSISSRKKAGELKKYVDFASALSYVERKLIG